MRVRSRSALACTTSTSASTETNVPPDACMRSTAARLWISDRPNRSSLATTSPSLAPNSIRANASSSSGRSARAPETSSSSKTRPTCAPRIAAQALICSPWMTGEMKLSPLSPAQLRHAYVPVDDHAPGFDAGPQRSPVVPTSSGKGESQVSPSSAGIAVGRGTAARWPVHRHIADHRSSGARRFLVAAQTGDRTLRRMNTLPRHPNERSVTPPKVSQPFSG